MSPSTKKICITAMGTALFVVLSLCLQVPVFENYYLCLGYVVMMLFCYYFGPISGMTVGGLGVVLYCLLTSGLRGMPGWAVGNLVIGLFVGLTCKFTLRIKKQWIRHIIIGISVVVSVAVAMLGVKSLVEAFLYAQPMLLRIAKNFYAFVADVVVMVISLPICISLKNIITKTFSQELMETKQIESDSVPDYGSGSVRLSLDGSEKTTEIYVRENRGRYSGNFAIWELSCSAELIERI